MWCGVLGNPCKKPEPEPPRASCTWHYITHSACNVELTLLHACDALRRLLCSKPAANPLSELPAMWRLLAAAALVAASTKEEDEVTSIPGFEQQFQQCLGFEVYIQRLP